MHKKLQQFLGPFPNMGLNQNFKNKKPQQLVTDSEKEDDIWDIMILQ